MIINSPTGFYRTVLPNGPTDSGNVTFVISAAPPPRTNLVFPKVPRGVLQRQKIPQVVDDVSIRAALGGLAYSVSRATQTQPGNNAKQFEIGQVIEFGTTAAADISPMLVAPITETRHDTNVFDYTALGLSDDEQRFLADTAMAAHRTIQQQLNVVKTGRADAEREINTQQKIVNEATRNLSALQIVYDATGDQEVKKLVDKFQQRADTASAKVAEATTLANSYAVQARDLQDRLIALAVVVK